MLVGLEIPLIMRILKRDVAFKDLVSQVLTFDYLGALAVSILFPVLLVPHLGWCAARCSSACSMSPSRSGRCGCSVRSCRRSPGCAGKALPPLLSWQQPLPGPVELTSIAERHLYADEVVHAESSPTSASSSRAGRTTCACISTTTCSSAHATNTATTRRSCILAGDAAGGEARARSRRW